LSRKEIQMLVLSRKPDEKIVFPGLGVTVRVVEVRGNQVRLGIEAPPDVKIMRAELLSPQESAAVEHLTTPDR
jgi:carbon storage regulator CsrA